MTAFDFDLFVIGAGSGGVRASRMAAGFGARVAIAEERFLGGTCVNVGCVPKKLFVYASQIPGEIATSAAYGWDIAVRHFDWALLRDNKNREIERLNGVYDRLLRESGVTLLQGKAQLRSANEVELGGKCYSAEKILITCGGRPYIPDFPGAELVLDSDAMFYLPELPQRMLIVGGGYIAVEFAAILHGLGVDVSLVYRGQRLLKHFDADLGLALAEHYLNKGISIHFQKEVLSITPGPQGGRLVHLSDGSDLSVDQVLYATGRKAYTDNLGLEEHTAIRLREDGTIVVNERFETGEPGIFALGDVTGGMELTPVAINEAMIFAQNEFAGKSLQMDYNMVPTAVFSQPNIATVGLGEEEARRQFASIRVYRSRFTPMKYALSGGGEKALMKLVVDEGSGRVVGAHMLGPDAGEIIQGFAVAMKAGATKAVFDATVGIHPTVAEEFVTMR